MPNVIKNLGTKSAVIIVIIALGAWPVGATVPGTLSQACPWIESLPTVCFDGDRKYHHPSPRSRHTLLSPAKLKAALAQDVDIARVFKAFRVRCPGDPELKVSEACNPCNWMECAVEAGKDMVEVANAVMTAGGDFGQVRGCLAKMGYSGPEGYTYSPPEPPIIPVGVGPPFPGGGGGGIASPAS